MTLLEKFAGTTANDTTVGSFAWINTVNAILEDGLLSGCVIGSAGDNHITNYLMLSNFNFNIPNNATIKGIIVKIKRQDILSPTTTTVDEFVRLMLSPAVIFPHNKAIGTVWTSTLTTITYPNNGSLTDLWGNAYTPAQVNASTFGVVLAARVSGVVTVGGLAVDYMSITINYSVPTSGGGRVSKMMTRSLPLPV